MTRDSQTTDMRRRGGATGEVARSLRTTRSEMLRSYLLWLLGKPGARPPSRPDNVDSGQKA